MDRFFHPVDDNPASRFGERPSIGFSLIPKGIVAGGDDEGVGLIRQVFFEKRRGIRIVPVVRRKIKLPVFAKPLGSQDIVLTVFADGRERRSLGRMIV